MERFAGRFELIRPLGQGGMGDVHLARDLMRGDTVALKRLGERWRAVSRETLRNEFEALAAVGHPAIVRVHDFDIAPDGTPYLSMEYVPGVPADQASLAHDWPALLFVAAELASALEALHAAGFVHGDLKPANVLVVRDPVAGTLPTSVRLLDLGLAGRLDRDRPGHTGTPGYQAPEVVHGVAPSTSSDLYGLGATLFTLATGEPPFAGADASIVLHRQQEGPPSALRLEQAGAPQGLIELILRLLAPMPAERPGSATALRRELERLHPAARRPLAERVETAVLVGRERELAAFETMAAGATGARRVLLVAGESGRGKTTLLEAFATRATLAGRLVVRRTIGAGELPGQTLRALTLRLEHEAGERHDPGEGAEDDESARWATRAQHAIELVAARRGEPVILLDGADLLDESTRTVLRRIWLSEPAPKALWVLACGVAALDESSAEQLLVAAGVATWCRPAALSRAEIAELAATRLGGAVPDPLLERLVETTGGHPGLVVAMLREAARRGAIATRDGALECDASAVAALTPPADHASAEEARLALLSPEQRATMLALAVAGRPLTREEIGVIGGETAAGGIPDLARAGLLVSDDHTRWSPVSRWAVDRIFEAESNDVRRDLHRRALTLPALSQRERFEHLRGLGDVPAALEAAEQAFVEMGDVRLAEAASTVAAAADASTRARWHERAARQHVLRFRYADALPHWREAWRSEPDRHPAAGARALGLVVAAIRSGAHAEAEEVATASIGGADPVTAARLAANRAVAIRYLHRIDEAIVAGLEALARAELAADGEAEFIAAQMLSLQYQDMQRLEDAEQMGQRAAAGARRPGVVAGETRAHYILAQMYRSLSRLEEAEQHALAGIEIARRDGPRPMLVDMLFVHSTLLLDSGRWGEFEQVVAELFRMTVADGVGPRAAVHLAQMALGNVLMGRSAEARRQLPSAMQLARSHSPSLIGQVWRTRAGMHRLQGQFSAAERATRRAMRLADARVDRFWAGMERLLTGMRRRRWSELELHVTPMLSRDGTITDNGDAVVHARLAVAEIARDAIPLAKERITAVETWVADHPMAYAAAMLAEARAALHLAERNAPKGIEEASMALARYGSMPAMGDRAVAALGFARIALAKNLEEAPVLEWLHLAEQSFARNGDFAGRCEALAMELEWRKRAPAPSGRPADSTDLLRRVSDLLRSYSDPRALTHRAMQLVVEQMGAERGVLLWMDAETHALTAIAEQGAIDAETREEAISYSRQVTNRVAESGGSILMSDVASDRRVLSDSIRNMKLRSLLCVPMFLSGAVCGAVYLDDSRRSHRFGDDERRLLEGFAGLMAVAIESSRGHERVERQRSELERENRDLLAQAAQRLRQTGLLGTSPEMRSVFEHIEAAARNTNTTVLITGESGTGKELVARTIHELSRRREKRFVVVNCGAIAATLLESELFGHKRGAFTGAMRDRQGAFELAHGGTLFLDEIAEMPLQQQVALLTVLSTRQVTPLGGDRSIPIDVRIVSATNADLRSRIAEGRFREDLFFRLRVLDIELPPLRDRKADIPALAQSFLEQFCQRDKRPVPRMQPQFMAVLMQSDWPGNVRELQNYVERVLARTEGSVLIPEPLPFDLQKTGPLPFIGARRLPDAITELERRMLRETLQRHEGNQSAAARELGVSEQKLRYKLRHLGLPSARQYQRTRKNQRDV